MKAINYVFRMEQSESITIQLVKTYCFEKIFYNTFAHVFFDQKEKRTLLAYDTLNEECIILTALCKKVLNNEYFLDEERIFDIGYIYSETFFNTVNSDYKDIKSESLFNEIDKYALWYPIIAMNNMHAWLYNNKLGQIILFIAPVYPYIFCSKRVKRYVPYDEWIQGYRPFVKRVISPKTVQQWVQQAEEIMKLIETNSRPYLEKSR